MSITKCGVSKNVLDIVIIHEKWRNELGNEFGAKINDK